MSRSPLRFRAATSLTLLVLGACASAQALPPVPAGEPAPGPAGERAQEGGKTHAAAAAHAFEAVRGDSAGLVAFLRAMPKGGDLHSHLSGAIYAESFLAWAAEDGACLVLPTMRLVPPPCDAAAGRPAVSEVQANETLRNDAVDAFSTRNLGPTDIGHERFFTPFERFGLASAGRTGDMLAEVSERAAAGRVRYLELMTSGAGRSAGRLGVQAGWDEDWSALRARILEAGLRDSLELGLVALDRAEARRDTLLGCGGPGARPGCAVTTRYLHQVARAFPPADVFAQILAGFELASMDPRVVGLNLVQPEDHFVAMRDYSLHMRILAFLGELYPDVPLTLHAGELSEGLVPPEGLRFHVREAVDVAGARRIGHGVDVLHEEDPDALLRAMAERRILVEINLTSNDVILGVRGGRHPLRTYLAYGVPVALSTDDEGVSRSEMTLEWRKAVEEQDVDYATLVAMARNSLEYAFVEGESLWADYGTKAPADACAAERGGLEGAACADWVEAHTRARLQRSFELDLRAFEARVAEGGWPVLARED